MLQKMSIIIFSALLVSFSSAQELAVPNTPVPTTAVAYHLISFSFERFPQWRFTITYADNNGLVYRDEHVGPSSRPDPSGGPSLVFPEGAETFVKQLNTANFSLTSLTKRLLQHLVTHGKIPASTIQGVPEGEK